MVANRVQHSESDPQDKMALLADGITQLQAAMLKQYDKTKDGDRSPSENIKPGTSVLPLLKDVAADTACVDIMDWMELIDAPMSDLSDGSASWWRRVVKEAYRTYGLWTLASPVERLTIAPEAGDLELYDLLEALGDVDRRVSTKTSASSWYTGAFVHGGVAGLRNNTRSGVARNLCGDIGFSAVGMAKNQQLGLHRDVHNSRNSMNYVIPLKLEEGGSIWVQKEDVEDDVKVPKTLPSGRELQGHLVDLQKGQPISFSPRRWHEVQPWKGERLVLLLYTPRSTKLTENDIKELNEMGFNLQPDVSQGDDGEVDNEEEEEENYERERADKVMVKMLQANDVQDAIFVEMEEEAFFDPEKVEEETTEDPLGEGQPRVRKTLLKKAEVQYTADVEAILEELDKTGSALEVTHNVSLGEVENIYQGGSSRPSRNTTT